jgi:hypothetical protein
MRRIADALALITIVVFGAVLRFSGIAVPSLWLDEILDYDVATKLAHEPFWHWLTGFASEHGPLFFATELAGRVAHTPELAARFAPAVFGVLAIVVGAVGWEGAVGGQRSAVGGGSEGSDDDNDEEPPTTADSRQPTAAALTFALLLAGSPLAIYYSREARPYALLMLIATAMLAFLLRGTSLTGSGRGTTALIVGLPFLALYTTSGAAPILAASALTAGIAFCFGRRRFFARYAAAALAALALVPVLYRRMPGNGAALGFRPFTARFFERLLQSFSIGALDVTTTHRAAYVVAALAIIGAVSLLLRDRVRGVIVIGMAVLPIAASIAALWRLRHWYAVRYIATALPAYLLLAAIGITTLLRLVLRGRTSVAVPIVALIAAGFVVREGWPSAATEPFRKLNWRVIAATIHEHAHQRDAVVTTNDWSYVCLGFYLRQLPPRVRLISAGESAARAASVVAHNEPVWIVSAGFHRPGDIGDWSCQYPVVLASPLESFRLHYVPGIRHLLLNRLTPSDLHALVGRYPSHVLRLGAESDFFLGGGWYGPEGETGDVSRWTGEQPVSAMLIASSSVDHRLLLRMMPFDYRGAAPQIATISLNDAPLARLPLAPGWHDYPFDVPRARWHDGVNDLTISFLRAEAPSSIDPASPDHRLLAARLSVIAVMPAGTAKAADSLPELTRTFRINEPAAEMLDENAWWKGRTKRGAAASPALLARIGIDPSRRVAVDNIAETVGYDSDCLNDTDFLHIAYATILGRSIDPDGERYFADALKKRETRVGVVRALVQSKEFGKRE